MTVAVRERRAASARDRSPVRRILRGTGWTLITAGVLLLLFVAYELWGTNLVTSRHQSALRDTLDRQFRAAAPEGDGAEPPSAPKPIPGEAVGIIRIPKIELNMAFVEGVDAEDLKMGPGHYPTTPLPGGPGNVGIAGHRTTYGRPFWSLDRMNPGDRIYVRTVEGSFVYEVVWRRVVTPDQNVVLDPTDRPSLTLTTCNPRFSAAERLIVRAVLLRGSAEAAA